MSQKHYRYLGNLLCSPVGCTRAASRLTNASSSCAWLRAVVSSPNRFLEGNRHRCGWVPVALCDSTAARFSRVVRRTMRRRVPWKQVKYAKEKAASVSHCDELLRGLSLLVDATIPITDSLLLPEHRTVRTRAFLWFLCFPLYMKGGRGRKQINIQRATPALLNETKRRTSPKFL